MSHALAYLTRTDVGVGSMSRTVPVNASGAHLAAALG
jgi:hypothetical protein